jgi:hypothetical protein
MGNQNLAMIDSDVESVHPHLKTPQTNHLHLRLHLFHHYLQFRLDQMTGKLPMDGSCSSTSQLHKMN